NTGSGSDLPADLSVCFRYDFRITGELLDPAYLFKLEVTSADPSINVWVNGREAITGTHEDATDPKKKKKDQWTRELDVALSLLRSGHNVIAARAAPPAGSRATLLALRLDRVAKAVASFGVLEEVKTVTHRAVVCDLCSSLPSQVPACVNACPHDAAMRVDARTEFPSR
ncbi:MAG: cyclic nucleotide-binding protein, partial [Planctomycetes bacterium]|nr:cyclic nucleotide-binding protein [Planctomycetota bacterium]